DRLAGDLRNGEPRARMAVQQALADQRTDRLADHRPRNLEHPATVALGRQFLARPETVVEDVGRQRLRYLFRKRRVALDFFQAQGFGHYHLTTADRSISRF